MEIKLTQYSKSAGCGCKIAPSNLEEILKTADTQNLFPGLIVGNETKDDAAIMEINEQQCLISTADFFMPIVDDAFDFGRISAANAISDVYAMGGKPIMALGILGWPVEKIPLQEARRVMEGAREICLSAKIPLAGGHSIDSPEPFFGLSVNGIIQKNEIKKNTGSKIGDVLYLSKKLGSGILATAIKRGLLGKEHYQELLQSLCTLNFAGEKLGKLEYVHAITDITGFGFIGHLAEMLQEDGIAAEIEYKSLPKFSAVEEYMSKFIYPDNTTRNYNTFKNWVEGMDGLEFLLLCDPQTNGGLLVSVNENNTQDFEKEMKSIEVEFTRIGKIIENRNKKIKILQ